MPQLAAVKSGTMRPVPNLTIPITLARQVNQPLHEQIAGQVGAAIRDGSLPPKAQLPSTRALAALLGVSRGVTIAAYDLLSANGCVRSEAGSGTGAGEDTSLRNFANPS